MPSPLLRNWPVGHATGEHLRDKVGYLRVLYLFPTMPNIGGMDNVTWLKKAEKGREKA
jgi:hypothetical protein